jgi:hypothetical protein
MWHVCGTAEPPELGVRGSPRWCREDPAACRAGSEGLKQRGRQPIRRGVRGGSPGYGRVLQVLADGERMNHLPQPNTDSGRSGTSRSILEPEAPPEALHRSVVSCRISGDPAGVHSHRSGYPRSGESGQGHLQNDALIAG